MCKNRPVLGKKGSCTRVSRAALRTTGPPAPFGALGAAESESEAAGQAFALRQLTRRTSRRTVPAPTASARTASPSSPPGSPIRLRGVTKMTTPSVASTSTVRGSPCRHVSAVAGATVGGDARWGGANGCPRCSLRLRHDRHCGVAVARHPRVSDSSAPRRLAHRSSVDAARGHRRVRRTVVVPCARAQPRDRPMVVPRRDHRSVDVRPSSAERDRLYGPETHSRQLRSRDGQALANVARTRRRRLFGDAAAPLSTSAKEPARAMAAPLGLLACHPTGDLSR
jgi:hypothetical protein